MLRETGALARVLNAFVVSDNYSNYYEEVFMQRSIILSIIVNQEFNMNIIGVNTIHCSNSDRTIQIPFKPVYVKCEVRKKQLENITMRLNSIGGLSLNETSSSGDIEGM